MWLEAARLEKPANAKAVLAKALFANSPARRRNSPKRSKFVVDFFWKKCGDFCDFSTFLVIIDIYIYELDI